MTRYAYAEIYDALESGDMLNPKTEKALEHLQAAEDAMLRVGMLIATHTGDPGGALSRIADTFANYGWSRPSIGGERDESGTGPAEQWLFEVTGDRPLIWAAWTDIADAQGMDDEFHPREDEEEN